MTPIIALILLVAGLVAYGAIVTTKLIIQGIKMSDPSAQIAKLRSDLETIKASEATLTSEVATLTASNAAKDATIAQLQAQLAAPPTTSVLTAPDQANLDVASADASALAAGTQPTSPPPPPPPPPPAPPAGG